MLSLLVTWADRNKTNPVDYAKYLRARRIELRGAAKAHAADATLQKVARFEAPAPFHKGQTVRILAGNFTDHEGVILSRAGADAYCVRIESANVTLSILSHELSEVS